MGVNVQRYRVADHLHRTVAEGHLKAAGVGAAENVGASARRRVARHVLHRIEHGAGAVPSCLVGPARDVLVVAHQRILVVAAVGAGGVPVGSQIFLANQIGVARPVSHVRDLDQTAAVHDAGGHPSNVGEAGLRVGRHLPRRILDFAGASRPRVGVVGEHRRPARSRAGTGVRVAAVGRIVGPSYHRRRVGVDLPASPHPRVGDRRPARGIIKDTERIRHALHVQVFLRRRIPRRADAQVVQRLLLDVGQDVIDPSTGLAPVGPAVGIAGPGESPAVGGKSPRGALVLQTAQGKLPEVVFALHQPGSLAGRLHRRQQQRNQNPDDRNDHQQLDQRKTAERTKWSLWLCRLQTGHKAPRSSELDGLGNRKVTSPILPEKRTSCTGGRLNGYARRATRNWARAWATARSRTATASAVAARRDWAD